MERHNIMNGIRFKVFTRIKLKLNKCNSKQINLADIR